MPDPSKNLPGEKTGETSGHLVSGSLDIEAGLAAAFGTHVRQDSKPDRSRSVYQPDTIVAEKFRLIEPIGEGGMGTVWYAEQTAPIKRKVALKLIKPGLDSRSVLARFDTERQALALMDHPNIAKVFDGGITDRGHPYFVMELVKGTSLTAFCDERRLDLNERIGLFVSVCQAIQHAHQKGVIHRDIKPSNIMVGLYDGKPVPKVIDFGVAKAIGPPLTDVSLHTDFGAVVGTAEYMSPEQAELDNIDIDTRSDVYSLGVLMYELLAGSPPFPRDELKVRGLHEVLRVIREVDPQRPSVKLSTSRMRASIAALRGIEPEALGKQLRGDLDWIVMKSLEKDRARRYDSPQAIARDLERYLRDEPVDACPPSARYRLRKFLRRYRWQAAGVGLLLTTLVAGIVGTSWQAIRATRAERAANHERDEKDQARREALASAGRARAAAESERKARREEAVQRKNAESSAKQAAEEAAVSKAVNEFLQQDLLGLAGAEALLEARMKPDPDLKLATLLDRAMANIDRRFTDQPGVRMELQNTLAGAFFRIGRYEEAARLRKQLQQHFESTRGPEHPDTLRSSGQLGLIYLYQSRFAEAEPLLTSALDGLRRSQGYENPDTLAAMSSLGWLYIEQARYGEAEPLLSRCLETTRRMLGAEHAATVAAMNNLAALYQDQAQYARAERLLASSLEISRRVKGDEHPATLNAMNNLAGLYGKQARFGEAESLLSQCLEIQSRVQGPEHPQTLIAMDSLASLFHYQGRDSEAELLCTRCLEIRRRVMGAEHPDTLHSMHNLAAIYLDQGKYAEAEPLSIQVLEISRRALGPEHALTLTSMNNLARQYEGQSRFAEAEPLYVQCLEITRRLKGAEHPDTLFTMNNLASLYQTLTRYAEAEQLYIQSVERYRRVLGSEHPDTLRAMNNLGSLFWKLKKFDQSIPLFEEVLRIRKQQQGEDHPDTLFTMGNLGVNYRDGGRLAEALPMLEEAFQASRKHPALSGFGKALADALLKAGKLPEAAKVVKKRLEMAREELPEASLELARELEQAGATLLQTRDWPDAEETLRECLKLREGRAPDDWYTHNTRSLLGEALLGQAKYAEAEPLLLAGYEGLKPQDAKTPADEKACFSQAMERLVQLYTEWAKPDQAAAWQQKIDEYNNR